MTQATLCTRCGAKTDAYLCKRCAGELAVTLSALPSLLGDLDTMMTRTDRIDAVSTPVYGRPDLLDIADQLYAAIPARLRSRHGRIALPATPWAYSVDAASVIADVRNTITTWIRHIAETRAIDVELAPAIEGPWHTFCMHGSCGEIRYDRRSSVMAIGWLVRNLESVRMDEAAAAIIDDLERVRRVAEQAIDRRDPDVFLGRCDGDDVRVDLVGEQIVPRHGECGVDLYAHIGDTKATCLACGLVYDVAARQVDLVARVYDVLAPTTQIADGLTGMLTRGGEPKPGERRETIEVTPSMIRNLASRGLIADRGLAPDGKSRLYRVGDVVDVLRAREERDRQRRSRRAS